MTGNFKVMGVINVTPDSFSDGGLFFQTDNAVKQAHNLIKQGADIIDIGGESTRPGAKEVSADEEISRVIPVIEKLRQTNKSITISIDTSKAEVMAEAIKAGADFINDVNALLSPGTLEVAAEYDVPVCLMHKQGMPQTMQHNPHYQDVVAEVMSFLDARIEACQKAGICSKNIIIDPGIGFGKTLEHNLALLKNIKQLKSLGYPLLIGVSRKTMIGQILDAEVDERIYGSLAIAQFAYMQGADIFRVHDVKATVDVLTMTKALMD